MARSLADIEHRTVKQLAQAKWQSSGLTDAHARTLGFRGLLSTQVTALSERFHRAGSLLIPYYDLAGKRTKFYRIRYLEKLPGAAGLAEKPQRYDQLSVLQEAYYPPLLDWQAIANDSTQQVVITEGELKAACACANGIPMLALGGVYSFMSGKRGVDLLPSLKLFKWEGRRVIIVYDNDVITKPEVLVAQGKLSQRLLSEGAKIFYGSLPPGPAKGVDDYIVAHGLDAFKALLEHAQPFLEGDALWKLNSEVVYIKEINAVVERDSGLLMDPHPFMNHVYGNRHFMQQVEVGSGKNKHTVLEKAKLAPRWVEWEQRAELGKLTYAPGEPQTYDNSWNLWRGWGVGPKRGGIKPWEKLLDFLFKDDLKFRVWFEQWCAYPIQHPGAKLFTAVLLCSRVKRLGKSLVGKALAAIYGENAVWINSKQLKGSFNSWAKNRQLVIGEEIMANEAKVDADWMKDVITGSIFTINEKFKPEYTIPNVTNFLFFSNHPDALFLEDGDKRYAIYSSRHTEKDRDAMYKDGLYKDYARWLEDGGAAHLRYHFDNLSLRGFQPYAHAPDTQGRWEMISLSKNDAGLWVQKLQDDPAAAMMPLGPSVAGCDLFSPDQIYRAFDPEGKGRISKIALGKALAAAGIRQVNNTPKGPIPVKTASGLHRLVAVRNITAWEQAGRAEIKAHYDQFFGPKTTGVVK